MRKKLELKTRHVKKSLAAKIYGDVDAGNAGHLREALEKAADEGTPVLFLDLSDVGKMDSAGIAVLVEIHDRLAGQGREFGLIKIPSTVKEMLELLGVFRIYSDLEDGLKRTQKLKPFRLHDPTKPIE